MNQQQPSFLPFPLPMISPYQGPHAPGVSYPPARVQVAVDYLLNLTFKTMPRVAVNDLSIDWQDGQKLTGPEVESQVAACDLLTEYFRGRLKPDGWEKQLSREREQERDTLAGVNGPGMAMRCLNCTPGNARPDCVMCHGSGNVMVYPMNTEG